MAGALADTARQTNRRVFPGAIMGWLYIPERLPHRTITLETASKSNLPHAVSSTHPTLCLRIGQLIPNRARRGIPKPMKGHPRRLHMNWPQLQILLQLINHSPATGMNTEMIKSQLEIRDIRLHILIEQLLKQKGSEEKKLFTNWENKRTQRSDISLQCTSCYCHQILRQGNPSFPRIVLLLVNASKCFIIGPTMSSHDMDKPILSPPPILSLIGEQNSSTPNPKQTIGN
ncbi:hypothetical protein RJ641_032335 [Dillenia turbinata]|uniref:Uncharacterized protein n=1 Tax=Dillenia turbinata TaxID=194707 RepID=A0AAN8VZU6_9MAGN